MFQSSFMQEAFHSLQVAADPRHRVTTKATLNNYELVPNLEQLTPEDWDDYYDTVVRPQRSRRERGRVAKYAAAARKRRAAEPGSKLTD